MSVDAQLTEYGAFSAKLLSAKLSDLCVDKIGVQTGPFGSQLHKEDYVEVGTPIITVEHLGDNRITHVDTPFVSDEDKARLSKYHLAEGDIVFSRVGSVDRRALVRKEEDGWLFSGRCLRVRVDKSKIDPVYLSYFFGLESFKNYIRSIAVGATMPSINTKILSDVLIYYPECLKEQRKIANIFYTSDDKIQLNRQTNQTLEHIAQAIFKSWFVDFEPTRAKTIVKQKGGNELAQELAAQAVICGAITLHKLAELEDGVLGIEKELHPLITKRFPNEGGVDLWQPQQLAAIATLFPNSLVDSVLGEVPEGWEVSSFSELAKLDTTSVKPNKKPEKVWEHFSIPAFDVDESPKFELGEAIKSNKYKVDKNSILSSKLNPNTPRTWWPDIEDENSAICSTEFMQFVPHKRDYRAFILGMILSKPFQEGILKRVTGSTGSRQRAQPPQVANMEVILPSEQLMKTYSEAIKSLYVRKAKNIKENTSLAKVRDALLPKLLSGELSIATTEKAKHV